MMNKIPTLKTEDLNPLNVVQQKMAMDQLRSNLSKEKDKELRLKETCLDFESIFIQKIWEQMRKSVPKEGYFHSKDEESYQAMFDVEFSKKMASAGGIGLADVLYDQLSRQLNYTARATSPHGSINSNIKNTEATSNTHASELKAEDLYTDLNLEENNEELFGEENILADNLNNTSNLANPQAQSSEQIIADAINALKEELKEKETSSEHKEAIVGSLEKAVASPSSSILLNPNESTVSLNKPSASPDTMNDDDKPKNISGVESTWLASGKVGIKSKPSAIGKGKKKKGKENKLNQEQTQNPNLPHYGSVISKFGWENTSDGKRQWNPGVTIAAKPGDPVIATQSGTILSVEPENNLSANVKVDIGKGIIATYGNLSPEGLSVGKKIEAGLPFAKVGQQVAYTGTDLASNTGKDLKNNYKENISPLFFSIKRGEMALNPMSLQLIMNS